MQDVVSRTDMKRMGVRLGRMGGQRNAGLSEERTQERGVLPILVLKLELMSSTRCVGEVVCAQSCTDSEWTSNYCLAGRREATS